LVLGTLLAVNGRAGAQAMPFLLGLSLLAIGTVQVLRALHVSDRLAYTVGGLAIVVVWLLPFRVVEALVPGAQMNFSIWVVGGLLIVLGAVWTVIYNADAFLGATMAVLGRVRSLSAVLKISMAYPLRNRLRTGMTLAMFTMVVFTLVVGITTPSSFIASSNKPQTFGGGFDVRAMTSPASPITDMTAAIRANKNIDARVVRAVASISTIPVKARQSGAKTFVDYPLHGFDQGFLDNNRYALGSRARGYTTDAQVWDAIAKGGNLAVVDPWIVPHRRNWSFGALTELKLSGFYAEDPTFDHVVVDVRDPESGRVTRFTVVGVLRDTMPFEMAGVSTSQRALASYGDRARPTTHLFALAPGTDAGHFATRLESAFLANGTQADSFAKLVHDSVAGSMVFLRLIEGFMGLGLIVGVAALGVIAARSVVERRQQIGVLRAIGFQASTVRLGLLLESGFLALTSIVVGTALGLAQAYNVVDDAHRQATWPGVHLIVPWMNLAVVFVIVMLVALATTYLPAKRASRVYPAEALRYE
ncbi:MAG TPA: FtsX-like permease family protein, partial [Acidimicrobiia bacterium]|nr:FtsX-like permease family protein [Acidimicrobiia bacterium]